MGQKSNPIGLRLGINKTWDSVWFDEKNFSDRIKEDLVIRNFVMSKYPTASISKVEIKRTSEKASVTINTATDVQIVFEGADGSKKVLKEKVSLLDGEIIDASVMNIVNTRVLDTKYIMIHAVNIIYAK